MAKGGFKTTTGVIDVGKYISNLQRVLDEQGRKKKWLIEQTGLNPGWITRLVKGDSLPNVHDAQKIANALGVEIKAIWPLEE